MGKIYKILPVFEERLWGGQRLRERFGYESSLENIAEVYNVIAISGHLDCTVQETGEKLSQFYHTHGELFSCSSPEMPVRMIMCAAEKPLSIQIHPDDPYALSHEGMRGKPEGSLVLECDKDFHMLHGHYAQTLEEFRNLAEKKDWDTLCRTIWPKQGEYIHIPSGTLHGFAPGAIVIAFSVNGDVTYRLYDYDRIDPVLGTKRPLHPKDVYANVNIPDQLIQPYRPEQERKDGCRISWYHDEPGVYSCGRIQTEGAVAKFTLEQFYFVTCVDGNGRINGQNIDTGETYFIPAGFGPLMLEGNLDLTFITYIGPEMPERQGMRECTRKQ